ncbi:hypothetical protein LPJ73_000811 [Coemansia sp. RSA 2703]|nr:hypothetical protein LPJ73_000811 [Coemansia sp. RSA 2703]KAJ2374733.1 hypothetical protein IW150_002936 [Coemansia sp. RSA 2607]KAJ2398461.1 hypothetical protein GGI05_000053 [Coemansia sp. RSA 2603]
MSVQNTSGKVQAIYFGQAARQRTAHLQSEAQADQTGLLASEAAPADEGSAGGQEQQQVQRVATETSRVANVVKLAVYIWFSRWFVRYFEIDRSVRGEADTPHISMFWLGVSAVSAVPFVAVYLYASVWRRRVLGEALDLQNWQTSANRMVHAATVGLLLAWGFAVVGLFPGYGVKSVVIVAVSTVCMVAMADAVEGIF